MSLLPLTSIISIIANPEKYDLQTVPVIGYLSIALEEQVLFLHREDYTHGIFPNSLWIEGNIDKYSLENRCHVALKGVFDKSIKGHMSLCTGGLRDISIIVKHPVHRK